MAICPILNKLLQVKSKQIDIEKELDNARTALIGCSYIDNPREWSNIFKNVTDLAGELFNLNDELHELEHRHVTINRGVLPY